MCGIFGNITKSVKSLSIVEVNILGMQNVERGKNSCGLTYDGEIYHGLDGQKIYTDFIKKRHIAPVKYPTIFGHTRNSSVGQINAFNAHPFGFGSLENGDFEFIGCHNGTLKNHEELAKKYHIELEEDYTNGYNVKCQRKKIDSEILLEILYRTKNYKVLSEYIGGAALAWTWIGEPNKMYLFSGKSKNYESSPSETEERPLCVYQRNRNSTFFSSIEESLYLLGGTEDNVHQIDHNTVYIITDGDFKNAEKLQLSRAKVTQIEPYVYKPSNSLTKPSQNYGRHSEADMYDEHDYHNYGHGVWNESGQGAHVRHNAVNNSGNNVTRDILNSQSVLNIYKEEHFVPVNDRFGKVYFHKLRYYRGGHVITGTYTWIKGYGYFHLGESMADVKNKINAHIGVKFVNGMFDKLCKEKDKGFIPFKLGCKPSLFYFIQGVMVHTQIDYIKGLRDIDRMPSAQQYLNALDLSEMSKHPVIAINFDTQPDRSQGAYLNGRLYSGTICPLGAERFYKFDSGNLVSMRTRKDIQVSFQRPQTQLPIVLPENLSVTEKKTHSNDVMEAAMDNILKFEKKFEELENDGIDYTNQSDTNFEKYIAQEMGEEIITDDTLENVDTNQMVLSLIDEEITSPVMTLNRLKGNLLPFCPNVIAKKGVELIEKFNKDFTELIEEPRN